MIGEPSVAIEPRLAAEDPYRADTIVDGGSAFGLTVRAASVRGLSKRWSGAPRQDDICLRLHAPTRTLIAAAADGVSAAPRSHIAAALAVRQAVAAVTHQLDAGVERDWQQVFRHAAWALVEEHRAASADPRAGPDEAAATLATTLLVAVIAAAEPIPPAGEDSAGCSAAVELASVGDSRALMLRRRRFHPLLGEQDELDGLIGGAVRALPRAGEDVCTARCELGEGSVLLLGTDGFALPLAGGQNEVGSVFARELARVPEIIDFARLLDFSRSTYDDDRSLIALWPRGEP